MLAIEELPIKGRVSLASLVPGNEVDGDFLLVESERLGMSASWFVSTALRTVLNPRRRKEGEPIGHVNAALEEALLPATGVLDRVLPQRTGVLTKMVFARAD